jgi:DNA replication and repair protein RecF
MKILRLDIAGLRCICEMRIVAGEGVHVLVGPNGAGKTTVLEAMHLLGYGRSFRSGQREAVIRRGAEHSLVFAELETASGRHRVGLRRTASDWSARIDESDVAGLVDLFRICPVVCFEPGSHALISGPAELRRAYLDWSVFHVEPDFLPAWRRHQRALKQRNAGLRSGWPDALLEPWERELADTGLRIATIRQRVLDELRGSVGRLAGAFLPELGAVHLSLSTGFGDRDTGSPEAIAAAYVAARGPDRERGQTRLGAHRADWGLGFDAAPRREHLSRGQEKLAALVMELAQVEHFRARTGDWPILLLDDLASELDQDHQRRVLDWMFAAGLQAWITGTEVPASLRDRSEAWRLFHVEQGAITPA